MPTPKIVDADQLDLDLTSVANAIRTKGGTSASLAFPTDFVSAIGAISGGGGGSEEITLLASGSFTRASTSPVNMSIPVSYTGTPKIVMVCVEDVLASTNQATAVYKDTRTINEDGTKYFPGGIIECRRRNSSNVYGFVEPSDMLSISGTAITANRPNPTYIWQPNTYHWYIWGVAE